MLKINFQAKRRDSQTHSWEPGLNVKLQQTTTSLSVFLGVLSVKKNVLQTKIGGRTYQEARCEAWNSWGLRGRGPDRLHPTDLKELPDVLTDLLPEKPDTSRERQEGSRQKNVHNFQKGGQECIPGYCHRGQMESLLFKPKCSTWGRRWSWCWSMRKELEFCWTFRAARAVVCWASSENESILQQT